LLLPSRADFIGTSELSCFSSSYICFCCCSNSTT